MGEERWIAMGHTTDAGILHIPESMEFSVEEVDDFEQALLDAMTKPILDTETTTVRSWGGKTHLSWTNPDYYTVVEELVDEKTGGHMAKRASTHADPKMEDGVWICRVCDSESMDRQMFEEAGEWEECAKNHAKVTTGEEKDALGRYVAGAEAKQNLDRATKAIQEFKKGMEKLGLAAADMSLMMQAMTGEEVAVTPEEVNRLAKKFPELKPTLDKVKFPAAVVEELKPLNERQWHKNLMSTLDTHYNWQMMASYPVADRVLDFMDDCVDFLLRR